MTATSPTAIPGGAAPPSITAAPRQRQTASPASVPEADPPSAPGGGRRGARPPPPDPLSDRATTLLIRRTLCPGDKSQRPLDELLPPLTSRNDVDLQLYAFLSIILRDFVQNWYGKITTDEGFVAEIIHTVAHCTRALEQRLRKVDLESLLLDEIPDLLDRHITAYRESVHPIAETPVRVDSREVYHALWPLPEMSPVPRADDESTVTEQLRSEAAYRQLLVQAVLAVLLPTEDLENPCLTSLVGQIFSELIIGNAVANKAAQPWVIFEGICILARIVEERRSKRSKAAVMLHGTPRAGDATNVSTAWSAHSLFLSIIKLCAFFIAIGRFLVGAITVASSLPPRFTALDAKDKLRPADQVLEHGSHAQTPVISFRLWSSVGSLLELPLRMPWLHGFLSLVQYAAADGPGHIGGLDGTMDRLLSHYIHTALSPSHLPPILRTLRGALFPNNAQGKPTLVPPSSDAELLALRRRAASALWGILPKTVARVYLGGPLLVRHGGADAADGASAEHEAMVDEVEGLLMIFSDEYCNKHLVYGALELILVRLMPELSEKGVEELLDERLG